MSVMSFDEAPNIPEGLNTLALEYDITLSENWQRYPTLATELSPDDRRCVELIKEAFLGLPLVHTTVPERLGNIMLTGLLPNDSIGEEDDRHTYALDRNLGLAGCVFLHLGVTNSSRHGTHHVRVSKEVLSDERCFVTPSDIKYASSSLLEQGVADLHSDVKEQIARDYVGNILPGTVWVEHLARKYLQRTKQGEAIVIERPDIFGEIKFNGAIAPGDLEGFVAPSDERKTWLEMLRAGFMPLPVFRANWGSPLADGIPEITHEDVQQARRYWGRLTTPTDNYEKGEL